MNVGGGGGDQRVIALIDMDCFYVQVEQRLQPDFLGTPCGVAQYYTWKGGGLIAVNYEARDFGVKRGKTMGFRWKFIVHSWHD